MGNKGKTKKMVRFEVLENKDATKEKNVQEALNSKRAQKLKADLLEADNILRNISFQYRKSSYSQYLQNLYSP